VIEGRVFDKHSGEPIGQALLLLLTRDMILHAITDEEGNYRIDNVQTGTHRLAAVHFGHFLDIRHVQLEPGDVIKVAFALLPFPFPPEIWRVILINAQTGEPIFGGRSHIAVTRWIAPGSDLDPWYGTTDSNGETLIQQVPRGPWPIVATADGFEPVVAELPMGGQNRSVLQDVATQSITLSLQPQGPPNAAGG
jgi:hypothetical protein